MSAMHWLHRFEIIYCACTVLEVFWFTEVEESSAIQISVSKLVITWEFSSIQIKQPVFCKLRSDMFEEANTAVLMQNIKIWRNWM